MKARKGNVASLRRRRTGAAVRASGTAGVCAWCAPGSAVHAGYVKCINRAVYTANARWRVQRSRTVQQREHVTSRDELTAEEHAAAAFEVIVSSEVSFSARPPRRLLSRQHVARQRERIRYAYRDEHRVSAARSSRARWRQDAHSRRALPDSRAPAAAVSTAAQPVEEVATAARLDGEDQHGTENRMPVAAACAQQTAAEERDAFPAARSYREGIQPLCACFRRSKQRSQRSLPKREDSAAAVFQMKGQQPACSGTEPAPPEPSLPPLTKRDSQPGGRGMSRARWRQAHQQRRRQRQPAAHARRRQTPFPPADRVADGRSHPAAERSFLKEDPDSL